MESLIVPAQAVKAAEIRAFYLIAGIGKLETIPLAHRDRSVNRAEQDFCYGGAGEIGGVVDAVVSAAEHQPCVLFQCANGHTNIGLQASPDRVPGDFNLMCFAETGKSRAGSHVYDTDRALRECMMDFFCHDFVTAAIKLTQFFGQRGCILGRHISRAHFHAKFIVEEVEQLVLFGIETGEERGSIADIHTAHGVADHADSGGVHIGEAFYIIEGVNCAKHGSAVAGVVAARRKIRIAVSIHVYSEDHEAAAEKLNDVGILHLVAVEIALTEDNGRAPHIAPVFAGGHGFLRDVEHSAECTAADVDVCFADQRIIARGFDCRGNAACNQHNHKTDCKDSPVLYGLVHRF